MADAIKFSSRPQYCHDVSWYPLSYRWPSVIFNQHFGLPPLLDPRDLSWMEGILRRLGTSAWPGYLRSPALAPFSQAAGQTISKLHREMRGGLSEVASEMCKWKISLDVNHFAPSEITVKIQDGFLDIAGKHEERQDEHGYIARSFTRKYNVPVGVDAEKIQTFVSADGILTVEGPLPSIPHPADVIIPVQVELEAQTTEEKQTDGHEPQAEGKPETFQPLGVPGEHLEVEAQERPGGQQIVSEMSRSDVGPSGEQAAPSITEPAVDVGEPGEEDKDKTVHEADVDTDRDSEDIYAEKPQAPETPDTVISEQEEQAEVISIGQPQQSVGEEYTYPAVTADEQSTFGQTQEIFNPQQVLQKEIAVEEMEVAK
ncbi:heat shock protein 67B1 [Triplophysa rosa]|uniref:Heat shock protein beta-1-like n=1 Tax=Triplophysa rosa TaxID=992332 RepID=A0A9W7X3K1_TRIRA|nr:heat shock protein 67B1 [Triplophysa rosa]KAI7813114.1 putative heat shock protein beta-1-like [Triplophysa rosa]